MSWNTSTVQTTKSTQKSDYDQLLENEKVIASSSFTINGNKIFKNNITFSSTAIVSKGIYKSRALFSNLKTSGVDGGTATAGGWRTRVLNTTTYNYLPGCSISSNQVILQPGIYLSRWDTMSVRTQKHQTRLRNITKSSTIGIGMSIYTENYFPVVSKGFSIFTLTSTNTIELQHKFKVTVNTNGRGKATNLGEPEKYASLYIERIG